MNNEQKYALALLDKLLEKSTSRRKREKKYLTSHLENVVLLVENDKKVLEKDTNEDNHSHENYIYDDDVYHEADKNFKNSWTNEWAFYVPPSMANALDIKVQELTKNKIKHLTYTQGMNFDFKAGFKIYNTKLAYENTNWAETLPKIQYAINIIEASPVINHENHGKVVFHFCRPNLETNSLQEIKTMSVTQVEFVRILITGEGIL